MLKEIPGRKAPAPLPSSTGGGASPTGAGFLLTQKARAVPGQTPARDVCDGRVPLGHSLLAEILESQPFDCRLLSSSPAAESASFAGCLLPATSASPLRDACPRWSQAPATLRTALPAQPISSSPYSSPAITKHFLISGLNSSCCDLNPFLLVRSATAVKYRGFSQLSLTSHVFKTFDY